MAGTKEGLGVQRELQALCRDRLLHLFWKAMATCMCWVSFKVAIIKAKAKESETPCNEVGVRKSRTPVLACNSFNFFLFKYFLKFKIKFILTKK